VRIAVEAILNQENVNVKDNVKRKRKENVNVKDNVKRKRKENVIRTPVVFITKAFKESNLKCYKKVWVF
jgi:hypothetical protein